MENISPNLTFVIMLVAMLGLMFFMQRSQKKQAQKRKNIISKHEYEEMYIIPLFGSSSLGINWMLWSQVSLGLR